MAVTSEDEQTAAFERFFLAQQPRLVAIGLGWCGEPEVAREVAQEALARAYRDWQRVSRLDIPGAWVRRVLINLLIDRQRSERRDRELVHRLGPPGVVAAPVVDDLRWWEAVRSLSERQRAVVTLHYLDELSVAEVAEILEIAPGTVKSTLSQARDRLRRILTEEVEE